MPWCQTKHIMEFAKDLKKGKEDLHEHGITISDELKLQHYMEQMYGCRLFNMEPMNHYEDYSKQDRTVLKTTTNFGELVEALTDTKKTVLHWQASMVLRVQRISRREKSR